MGITHRGNVRSTAGCRNNAVFFSVWHIPAPLRDSTYCTSLLQEVSESSALSEGEDWADTLLGPQVKPTGRSGAFDRLPPGRRPDTIVLRGIPVNWLAEKGRAEEGMPAPVRYLLIPTNG